MPFPINLQKIMARTQILVKKFRFLYQWPYIGHPHNISAVGHDLETVAPFETSYPACIYFIKHCTVHCTLYSVLYTALYTELSIASCQSASLTFLLS